MPSNFFLHVVVQGTSRGGANIKEIVRRIALWGLNMVFVIGGNGGNAGELCGMKVRNKCILFLVRSAFLTAGGVCIHLELMPCGLFLGRCLVLFLSSLLESCDAHEVTIAHLCVHCCL